MLAREDDTSASRSLRGAQKDGDEEAATDRVTKLDDEATIAEENRLANLNIIYDTEVFC